MDMAGIVDMTDTKLRLVDLNLHGDGTICAPFEYRPSDLSLYSDDEIIEKILSRAALLLPKHCFSLDYGEQFIKICNFIQMDVTVKPIAAISSFRVSRIK